MWGSNQPHDLLFWKNKAKPPARRGCSAYASESDVHNSSIVILHSKGSTLRHSIFENKKIESQNFHDFHLTCQYLNNSIISDILISFRV
jgi:hypothetical protein